ncbi:MAG: hypothetical protein LV479_02920 [Methylacidiphilales bacterium]|nr:hypothetical protein [Candidatus Methylacidiphilales bacterium]
MKHISSLRRGVGVALGSFLMAIAFSGPAPGQEISKNLIQQSQADQQDIRNHTSSVVDQVQTLIDELAANGISGDDNKVLLATKAALNNLSGPEMERVITALQQAAQSNDTNVTQQSAVKAFTGQKGIIVQFQQILKEYAQRQAAYELPLRFKELTDRQTETLRTTAEVATRTVGQSASQVSSMDQTTVQIVQTDQTAIASDVAQAQDMLAKAIQDSTDDTTNMEQAMADLKTGKLQQALTQSENEIGSGNLLRAVGEQKIARDELRRITRDLNPPPDLVDALTSLDGDLAQLIESQKKVLEQTNGAISSKTMDASLKDKQVVIVDKADLLQQDLQSLSPDASALVKDSLTPMQMSRSMLRDLSVFALAVPPQNDAIAKLLEAQKKLEQQVADAEKAEEDANKDPVAKMQEMKQKIEAAIQQQKQVAQETNQANNDPNTLDDAQKKQDKLQQDTSNLQTDAQPLSLTAAQAIKNAANAMDKADKDLNDTNKTDDAQKNQDQAINDLTEADKELDKEIAKDQQQEQPDANANDLDNAAAALQKSQDDAGDAQADAQPPPPGTPDTDAADKALGDADKNAQDAANTPGLPQDAQKDVKAAQDEIAKGKDAAGKKDAHGTADHAAKAQQALAKAQAKVAEAMASAPPPPGQQPSRISGNVVNHSTHIAGGDNRKGTLHGANGADKFIALVKRQRGAVDVTQEEKRPQEYAPMIDQYMKNLADQATTQ